MLKNILFSALNIRKEAIFESEHVSCSFSFSRAGELKW